MTMSRTRAITIATLCLTSLLASTSALAHPGHDSTGLMALLAHALFGWHDLLGVLVMTVLVAGAGIGLLRAARRPEGDDKQRPGTAARRPSGDH